MEGWEEKEDREVEKNEELRGETKKMKNRKNETKMYATEWNKGEATRDKNK